MSIEERLAATLRREEDIPESYRVGPPLMQHEYLVAGDLKTWGGPFQEVRSPVFLGSEGNLEAKLLGSFPLMSAGEALAALNEAVNAYGNGRGLWP